jgi:hypothetical protein
VLVVVDHGFETTIGKEQILCQKHNSFDIKKHFSEPEDDKI